jgi:hypothetical protein
MIPIVASVVGEVPVVGGFLVVVAGIMTWEKISGKDITDPKRPKPKGGEQVDGSGPWGRRAD